jgi:hypothetical protein
MPLEGGPQDRRKWITQCSSLRRHVNLRRHNNGWIYRQFRVEIANHYRWWSNLLARKLGRCAFGSGKFVSFSAPSTATDDNAGRGQNIRTYRDDLSNNGGELPGELLSMLPKNMAGDHNQDHCQSVRGKRKQKAAGSPIRCLICASVGRDLALVALCFGPRMFLGSHGQQSQAYLYLHFTILCFFGSYWR